MNAGLQKKVENDFFKLINNSDFGRSMVNARRHRDIELATAERRRNYLVPEANYHTTKFFKKNLLTIEMRETQILMNKPVYLGISTLDLRKIVTYVFLVLLCRTKIS